MDVSKLRRELESRHAEAQLRLARENDKLNPDMLKLDRYGKEAAEAGSMLAELDRRAALMQEGEGALKQELDFFSSLLTNKGRITRSEALAKIKFKDKMWEGLFFEYVEQNRLAKKSRALVLFGEEVYEKI